MPYLPQKVVHGTWALHPLHAGWLFHQKTFTLCPFASVKDVKRFVSLLISFKVHKETIDKVPNSIPTRGNIEIEIYGTDGIPEQDKREYERQKGGNSKNPFTFSLITSVATYQK